MTVSFGQRLSAHEYRKQVLALHTALSGVSARKDAAALRRREFDLTIDHRLGVAFPRDRRECLWDAHERIQRRKVPALAIGTIRKVLGAKQSVEDRLYRLVLLEYGRVLTPEELSLMVDLPVSELSNR